MVLDIHFIHSNGPHFHFLDVVEAPSVKVTLVVVDHGDGGGRDGAGK